MNSSHSQPNHNLLDSVILVDEFDHPIGTLDKYEAHRHGAKLHRAVSVYLFRINPVTDQVELLVQQRSAQKIVGAGLWANTVCGNVRPGESYRDCAERRLREELWIPDWKVPTFSIESVYKFQYFVPCTPEFSEREMDCVFVGFWSKKSPEFEQKKVVQPTEIVHNPSEVQATKWIDFHELVSAAKREDWNSQSMQSPVWENLALAPWFIWMLRDMQLQDIFEQIFQRQRTYQYSV